MKNVDKVFIVNIIGKYSGSSQSDIDDVCITDGQALFERQVTAGHVGDKVHILHVVLASKAKNEAYVKQKYKVYATGGREMPTSTERVGVYVSSHAVMTLTDKRSLLHNHRGNDIADLLADLGFTSIVKVCFVACSAGGNTTFATEFCARMHQLGMQPKLALWAGYVGICYDDFYTQSFMANYKLLDKAGTEIAPNQTSGHKGRKVVFHSGAYRLVTPTLRQGYKSFYRCVEGQLVPIDETAWKE